MSKNAIFNASVCIMGIAILLIHVVNVLIKKNRRKDENVLLSFLLFTVIHFSVYLTYTFLKMNKLSNGVIIGFYTTFYIFNNLEVLFFSAYIKSYTNLKKKLESALVIVNLALFGIYTILDIINIFNGMFFTAVDGEYVRAGTMFIAQGYQFIVLIAAIFVIFFNKNLLLREKIGFGCYCILPGVAIIIQNALPGYAIAYLSIVIAIEILFLFLNVQKNILLTEEKEKNKDSQIRIMMSQIQPHFIYNSLSAISTLITINPDEAQKVLDDFTEYLRHNLSSLTQTHLITFTDELRHIETYVNLEKMRFKGRIKVSYDIKASDFDVPPLSIQPIVENAIKHGLLKTVDGGTIIFKTYETNEAYIVEVIDDGVGFDMDSINYEENKHFGINNIRNRLETMCHGTLDITSEVGKGTKAVITFYKE